MKRLVHRFWRWVDYVKISFAKTGHSLDTIVYVIHLFKNRARLRHFKWQLQLSDLKNTHYEVIPAIDGKRLNIERLLTQDAHDTLLFTEDIGYRTKHHQLTRGAIGCYMSHLHTYRQAIDTYADFVFVCEDDAVFPVNMHEEMCKIIHAVPSEWDLIVFTPYIHEATEYDTYQQVYKFWGTHTYLIRRKAMYMLLKEYDFPIDRQLDAQLTYLASTKQLQIFAPLHTVTYQRKDKFESDIHFPIKIVDGIDPFDQEG